MLSRLKVARIVPGALLALVSAAVVTATVGVNPAAAGTQTPASAGLVGTSCLPRASWCMAVGWWARGTSDQGVSQPFAEEEQQGHWRVVRPPALRYGARLTGVSCTSKSWCVATSTDGTKTHPYGGRKILIEEWNGRRWSPTILGNPPAATVTGVSCYSRTACTAVGYADSEDGLVIRWNGRSWRSRLLVTRPHNSWLSAVSCPARRRCVAVGRTAVGSVPLQPLIETWHGRGWHPTILPITANAQSVDPVSVSCATPTSCTATGWWSDAENQYAYSAVLEGSGWAGWFAPAGTEPAGFGAISCPTAASCVVLEALTAGPLGDAYSGRSGSWRPSPYGMPTGGFENGGVAGLSCHGPHACLAVGYYSAVVDHQSVPRPLIETWNGRRWEAGYPPVRS